MKKQILFTRAHKTAAGLALSLAMLCAAPFPAAQSAAALIDGHYTTAFPSAQERSAGNLVNSDRERYGLPALSLDPALCRIARIKAEDMRDNQYFAHTSATYGDVRQMLTTFGHPFNAASENIAHHATLEKAQAALISSPGHRRNILSERFTHMGMGIALDEKGFIYLTQIFCN